MAEVEKGKKLAPKQERFALEYLKDLNATKAAVRAGYSEKSAQVTSSRMLSDPRIKAIVQAHMDERGRRTRMSADQVLMELERLAAWDPKDFVHIKAPEDIASLPEEARRAIVGWGYDRSRNFFVKLAKEKALELLGKHHKLFTDRIQHEAGESLAELLAKSWDE